jgi:predicted DNA-binding transcriptional regulator AlpA
MSTKTIQEYVGNTQLAQKLGISTTSVWRMKRDGLLPPQVRLTPHKTVWRVADIDAWLASRERV